MNGLFNSLLRFLPLLSCHYIYIFCSPMSIPFSISYVFREPQITRILILFLLGNGLGCSCYCFLMVAAHVLSFHCFFFPIFFSFISIQFALQYCNVYSGEDLNLITFLYHWNGMSISGPRDPRARPNCKRTQTQIQ